MYTDKKYQTSHNNNNYRHTTRLFKPNTDLSVIQHHPNTKDTTALFFSYAVWYCVCNSLSKALKNPDAKYWIQLQRHTFHSHLQPWTPPPASLMQPAVWSQSVPSHPQVDGSSLSLPAPHPQPTTQVTTLQDVHHPLFSNSLYKIYFILYTLCSILPPASVKYYVLTFKLLIISLADCR